MTKDILVSISGLQVSPEMESDTVEVISPGEYYYRNDKHFVVYEEAIDGKTETVKNMVKLSKDCVEVTKKGPARIHMIFEKNKKNISFNMRNCLLLVMSEKKILIYYIYFCEYCLSLFKLSESEIINKLSNDYKYTTCQFSVYIEEVILKLIHM